MFTTYHLDGNTAQFRMMTDDDTSCLLHGCSAHMLQSICRVGMPTCRARSGPNRESARVKAAPQDVYGRAEHVEQIASCRVRSVMSSYYVQRTRASET